MQRFGRPRASPHDRSFTPVARLRLLLRKNRPPKSPPAGRVFSGAIQMLRGTVVAAVRLLKGAWGDRRANVAVMTALLSPIIIGGLGIGSETAYWYATQREMQNAA